jgi:putative salt-induced outer membrane protein
MIRIRRHFECCTAFLLALTGTVSVRAQTDPAPAEKKPSWTGSMALGFTLTSGNSDTTLATLTGAADHKWGKNELSLSGDGAYGQSKVNPATNTTTTAEFLRGSIQYNRLFTERLYGYARVEGRHDGVADIRYRVTLSPGIGYYFIKAEHTDLSAEVGPGYVFEQLGDDSRNYATLRVAEKFNQTLSDRARLWQSVEWLPQVDDFNNYVINGQIGIEADLTKDKRFTLRTYVQDTFNNEPAPGRKQNDLGWITAVAYKF